MTPDIGLPSKPALFDPYSDFDASSQTYDVSRKHHLPLADDAPLGARSRHQRLWVKLVQDSVTLI